MSPSGEQKRECIETGERELRNIRRIDRDEFFRDLAFSLSRRATCPKLKVGAIIVENQRKVVAMGYNGSLKDTPHCENIGCLIGPKGNCIRTLHAEMNAIANWTKIMGNLAHYRMYVTVRPCLSCLKISVAAGISSILYYLHRDDQELDLFLQETNFRGLIKLEAPTNYPT